MLALDRVAIEGIIEWREVALRRQKASIRVLPLSLYNYFLKPQYTKLAYSARLKLEQLECIIVGNIQLRK